MKLLLTSVGLTNDSIRKALLELLGKPLEECRAVQISTALYASPSGPEDVYEMAKYYGEMGWKELGTLELIALPTIEKEYWLPEGILAAVRRVFGRHLGERRQHRVPQSLVPGVGVRRDAAPAAGGEGLLRDQRRQHDGDPGPELRPGAPGAGGRLLRRRVRGGRAPERGQRVGDGSCGLRLSSAPEGGLLSDGEHGDDGAGGGEARLPPVRYRRRDGHQGGGRGGGGCLGGRVEAVRWIARREFGGVERAEAAKEARDESARSCSGQSWWQTSRSVENWRLAWKITETSASSPCLTTRGTQGCGWVRVPGTYWKTGSAKGCGRGGGGRA